MSTYLIKSGDNLTRIAQQNGTTVQALLAANPQITNPNLIYAGQNLTIPSTTQQTTQTSISNPQTQQMQTQLADLQAQQKALQQYGLTDTNQLSRDASGNYVPTQGGDNAYNTGNPELDAMLKELQKGLGNLTAAGKVINPNIELSPAQIQQFLDQATTEISPYYASLIGSIKDDLTKSIGNLQKQYDLQKQGAEEQFKQTLGTSRESAAERGLTFSGVRGGQEQDFASSTQRQLDLSALGLEGQVGGQLRNLEGQIGSSGLPQLPQFQTSNVSLAGQGGFTGGRTLDFSPTGGLFGTLPAQQLTSIKQRQSELETAARQGRVLDFYNN